MLNKKTYHMWNPWHGCHKISDGCKNCYVFAQDKAFNKDSSVVTKNITNFNLPLRLNKKREYAIPKKSTIMTCFTSDFFVEEADKWRDDAWNIIKKRSDVTFLIPTKRIHRFFECIPKDWNNGYKNVVIAVTAENQKFADKRLPFFLELPIAHKIVFVSPILEQVNLEKFLASKKIKQVCVGGESYENARECNFDWVLNLYEQCKKFGVSFSFHQTGSNFKKDGKTFKISHYKEYSQAKKAGLDF